MKPEALLELCREAVSKPHGHVTPKAGRPVARCGGPGLCRHCLLELIAPLAKQLARLQDLVNVQAEDGGLWFVAQTAAEAYLQQELRKLHAAIEGGSAR